MRKSAAEFATTCSYPRHFDSHPVRAYTQINGFTSTLPAILWLPHQLGWDADARHSQHHHGLHWNVLGANADSIVFSAILHGNFQPCGRSDALVRHAQAFFVA